MLQLCCIVAEGPGKVNAALAPLFLCAPKLYINLGIPLEMEHDNFRAALAWAAASPTRGEEGLRMVTALWRFWWTRGHLTEARILLAGAIARAETVVAPSMRANALHAAALLVHSLGEYGEAETLYEQALLLRREQGDWNGIAATLNNLGLIMSLQKNFALARQYFEEALQINQRTSHRPREANNLSNLGIIAVMLEQSTEAQVFYEAALQIHSSIGSHAFGPGNLLNMGSLAMSQGENAAAKTWIVEAIFVAKKLGHRVYLSYALDGMARLLVRQGHSERAARLWGASEALRETIAAPVPPNEREDYDRSVAEAKQAVGAQTFDAVWAEGRSLSMEQAIALALK